MNRSWIACLMVVLAALTAGCGGMKETFQYRTAASVAGTERGKASAASARSCKTPLRVAVTTFADDRKHEVHGAEAATLASLSGFVVAPATSLEISHPSKLSALYVHDDGRLFALALYSELVASGCFAEVALDPLDESQYDLLFTGTIRRFG